MLSSFTRDLADDRRQVEEAFAEREGKSLRVRIQPQLLRAAKHRASQYMVWKDVSWTLDFANPKEVFSTRDALQVFFRVLATAGPKAVIRALGEVEKAEKVEVA